MDETARVRARLRPVVDAALLELARVRSCKVSALSVGDERAIETAVETAWLLCDGEHRAKAAAAMAAARAHWEAEHRARQSGTWEQVGQALTPVVTPDEHGS